MNQEILPDKIQQHLKQLAAKVNPDNPDEVLLELSRIWQEKDAAFSRSMTEKGLKAVNELKKDDARAWIAMTYSGSIVMIGPGTTTEKELAYISLGIRKDVPPALNLQTVVLMESVRKENPVRFSSGPVQKTSPVYRLAVTDFAMEPVKQKQIAMETAEELTRVFSDINQTLVI